MLSTRQATPADHAAIAAVADDWWGRPIVDKLPHLFLDHFWATSSIVEDEDGLAGFLIGFVSPSDAHVAYIHFVGVRPDLRREGVAGTLYRDFFDFVRGRGCTEVHAVTDPRNATSIAFHRRMGFTVSDPIPDYDGPGRSSVTFSRRLDGPDAPADGR